MLRLRDMENLKKLGEKCMEAEFSPIQLVYMMSEKDPIFPVVVQSILADKDCKLDSEELEMLRWARTLIFRIVKKDAYDAESYILEGYYSQGGSTPQR